MYKREETILTVQKTPAPSAHGTPRVSRSLGPEVRTDRPRPVRFDTKRPKKHYLVTLFAFTPQILNS